MSAAKKQLKKARRNPEHELRIVRLKPQTEAKCVCGKWSMKTASQKTETDARNKVKGWFGEHLRNVGVQENPQKIFTPQQLAHLRGEFEQIKDANTIHQRRAQINQVLAGATKPLLKQIADANIPWLSPIAKNLYMRRLRNPAKGKGQRAKSKAKTNLHPIEAGAGVATIIGGLDHLWQMMNRGKKKAKGSGGNDIECFIVDEDGLENFSNGHSVPVYYQSGRVTVATINVVLREGRYYLVFSNTYSAMTPKAVNASVFIKLPNEQ